MSNKYFQFQRMTQRLAIALAGILCLFTAACLEIDDSNNDEKNQGPIGVIFHLQGEFPSFTPTGSLFAPAGLSQEEFVKRIRKASNDVRVSEIVIHISRIGAGWARIEETSRAIANAAKNVKVSCVLESVDNKTYFLAATACPVIAMAPAGSVDLIGLSMETLYFKDLLDNLGVKADMLHVGEYKSAAENVTRNDMSEAARDANKTLLKSINHQFITKIAKSRGLAPDKVKKILDNGPYDAHQAKKLKLIDKVESIAARMESMHKRHNGGIKRDYGKPEAEDVGITDLLKMLSSKKPKEDKSNQPIIALVPAIGPIASGLSQNSGFGSSDQIVDIPLIDTLLKAAGDQNVKAVVLRIDSPGGSALASDNIWDAVKAVARKKPIVVSMGDVAASGGYYIASAADYVYANPTTITGSIGVVGGKIALGTGLERLGIHSDGIKLAQNAGMYSPLQPFTDSERKVVLRSMENAYGLFLRRVSKGRDMKKDAVEKYAKGRVWTGVQAQKAGLIDELGSLQSAIKKARALASAEGVKAKLYPPPKTFLEFIAEQLAGDQAMVQVLRQYPVLRDATALAHLLQTNRVLYVSPYLIHVQ